MPLVRFAVISKHYAGEE